MNKAELIDAVAEKSGLTKAQSKEALDAVLSSIQDALKKDDKIQLIGFGTFSVEHKAARTGINPRTKEAIQIAAKNVAKFKGGKGLLD